MSAANATQIQTIIDAKIALLNTVVTKLAEIIVSPKADYDCDGQRVSWSQYQKYLLDLQETEGKAIEQLIKLKRIMRPYQFVSAGC